MIVSLLRYKSILIHNRIIKVEAMFQCLFGCRTRGVSRRLRYLASITLVLNVLISIKLFVTLVERKPNDTPAPEFSFDGKLTKLPHSTAYYIAYNNTLHHLPSCFICGRGLNLCKSLSVIPWGKTLLHPFEHGSAYAINALPISGSKFDCRGDIPQSILALAKNVIFSEHQPGIITSDDGISYVALSDDSHNQRLVKLLSCVDCGPIFGNICGRIPNRGTIITNLIYTIGGWPEPKPPLTTMTDNTPIFACHRDMPDMIKPLRTARWLIISPPHVMFMANLMANALDAHGFFTEIVSEPLPSYGQHDVYIVLSANAYIFATELKPNSKFKLPPADKRLVVQLEQQSSHWFKEDYLTFLRDSYAVLEYNLENIAFLQEKNIKERLWYLPLGGNSNMLSAPIKKKWDLIFFGDLRVERRVKMLNALSKEFEVKIVTETFGEEMHDLIKQARFVINIHYFIPPFLEVFRIYESLSLGVPVISENSPDSWMYPDFGSSVQFFDVGSTSSMLKVVRSALSESFEVANVDTKRVVKRSHAEFLFNFNRVLFGMELLPVTSIDEVLKHSRLEIPKTITKPLILSLPESPRRREQFLKLTKVPVGPLFGGVRHLFRGTWMACAMSYSAMAALALDAGVTRLSIAEDDVVFPENFEYNIGIVEEYLDKLDDWDMFSGLIADLNPGTKIYSAEKYKGIQFVMINKMTSTVFNIYNTSLLRLLAKWDPMSENVLVNTIDRYVESQTNLKIVVAVPFFVGHREEAKSTIWAHSNTAYVDMIANSERKLLSLVDDFKAGINKD